VLDHITGKVHRVGDDSAVVSVGGVGIRVEMPTQDLTKLDGDATVYTVLQIRDEEIHLYGFVTERSRELFRMLTSVQSVGPKVALAILSAYTPEKLERSIALGDEGALTAVTGVGKKTAARIVLDLRDKVGAIAEAVAVSANGGSSITEVREGLKGLGYSTQEIQEVLATLPPDGDAPTLMRHALRALGSERSGINN
jgi:Holliday junction DNA helicase RuvA